MSGHGHVIPNPDGSRAKCGGPGICNQCAIEDSQVRLAYQVPAIREMDELRSQLRESQARVSELESLVRAKDEVLSFYSNASDSAVFQDSGARAEEALALTPESLRKEAAEREPVIKELLHSINTVATLIVDEKNYDGWLHRSIAEDALEAYRSRGGGK